MMMILPRKKAVGRSVETTRARSIEEEEREEEDPFGGQAQGNASDRDAALITARKALAKNPHDLEAAAIFNSSNLNRSHVAPKDGMQTIKLGPSGGLVRLPLSSFSSLPPPTLSGGDRENDPSGFDSADPPERDILQDMYDVPMVGAGADLDDGVESVDVYRDNMVNDKEMQIVELGFTIFSLGARNLAEIPHCAFDSSFEMPRSSTDIIHIRPSERLHWRHGPRYEDYNNMDKVAFAGWPCRRSVHIRHREIDQYIQKMVEKEEKSADRVIFVMHAAHLEESGLNADKLHALNGRLSVPPNLDTQQLYAYGSDTNINSNNPGLGSLVKDVFGMRDDQIRRLVLYNAAHDSYQTMCLLMKKVQLGLRRLAAK
ncbi:hypothetical protein BKA65DRAFT_473228 [Rhexocercosporidium sp. MPI-PUGE-AT-0058]|nr:hypothetical protein BKA65DRAFT_473228 [Rhexocercosporidium sp. MPI-PUGE-AT-0058]